MSKRTLIALGVLVALAAVAGAMYLTQRPPTARVVSTTTRPDDSTYVLSPISGKRHQLSEFKPMPGSTTMVICPDTGKPIPRGKLLAQTTAK